MNKKEIRRKYYLKNIDKIIEQSKNYYLKNKEKICKRAIKIKQDKKTFIRTLKNKLCADCGVKYPYYVMDFDHNGLIDKEFGLNKGWNMSFEKIKKEAEKCDVVCANCHRIRTFKRNTSS